MYRELKTANIFFKKTKVIEKIKLKHASFVCTVAGLNEVISIFYIIIFRQLVNSGKQNIFAHV